MSGDDFDFEADLAALLAPGAASAVPTQSEPQEAAAAAPELDLMSLLSPGQASPEPDYQSTPVTVQADDFNVRQVLDGPSALAAAADLAPMAEVAEKRSQLEDKLLDLYMQLDAGQVLLERGLWSPEDRRICLFLIRRIEAATWAWRWTETEAWRMAYDAGLIPAQPRRADWSPFQLLNGQHP